MTTLSHRPVHTRIGDSSLARRLKRELEGDVLFGAFDRGMYATDASIYQIEPVGVVRPRSNADIEAALAIAVEEGVPVLARGAGTSQAGQSVGQALVIDHSRYLHTIGELDPNERALWVEPGVVLEALNRQLKPLGLQFPVDISTATRATIAGMAGNNASGSRSLRYGVMADHVLAVEVLTADGQQVRFEGSKAAGGSGGRLQALVQGLVSKHGEAIRRAFPDVPRNVGGYGLDRVAEGGPHHMARLLVGSEGTLAFFTRCRLKLSPLPARRVLAVCHFETFRQAMQAPRHIVQLGPSAVELVDRSILDLAGALPAFSRHLRHFVEGKPAALLLVEFDGDKEEALTRDLDRLEVLLRDHGFDGPVVRAIEPVLQARIWELRAAGLNIAMSMKGDAKPVSFIEDCCVPLRHLADYTEGLNEVFARHGTRATWYAHASVGCLHVRPILNLKQDQGVAAMRAIGEEAFELVRSLGGAYSGEHGDGLVRSEYVERQYGPELALAFEALKDGFDPKGLLNPGKIVRPPAQDARELFRFKPGYGAAPIEPALDWSARGSMLAAAEMCNNNGACRKQAGGVMCPSFRATLEEKHATRGRANLLRLALSGQLGREALVSDEMAEALALCVSCKACRRECPTGVDMARLKIEAQAQRVRKMGLGLADRLIAHLPRLAPWGRFLGAPIAISNALPVAAGLSEKLLGFSARRLLPRFHPRPYRSARNGVAPAGAGRMAVLFADTFNRWFEPDNLRAAERILEAVQCRPVDATPRGERPLCCGRTYLSQGLVDQARKEAERTAAALLPHIRAGTLVVGLEPSCVLTLVDEHEALLSKETAREVAAAVRLFSTFVKELDQAGRLRRHWRTAKKGREVLVHGHCHEKAFGLAEDTLACLGLVPGLEVRAIETSCCGMAGAFGYQARHFDTSMAMAELSLLPAVREAAADAIIVANGTSCRQQIQDASGREAVHLACVLADALA